MGLYGGNVILRTSCCVIDALLHWLETMAYRCYHRDRFVFKQNIEVTGKKG